MTALVTWRNLAIATGILVLIFSVGFLSWFFHWGNAEIWGSAYERRVHGAPGICDHQLVRGRGESWYHLYTCYTEEKRQAAAAAVNREDWFGSFAVAIFVHLAVIAFIFRRPLGEWFRSTNVDGTSSSDLD